MSVALSFYPQVNVGEWQLSGTKLASQNRNDLGGRKQARNHSVAEIARFFDSPAARQSQLRDFGISLKIEGSSQRPWDTKNGNNLQNP